MVAKKAFEKKSFQELQKELESYSERAMDNIKEHFHSPEEVLELAEFMGQFYHYSLKNVGMIQAQFPGSYAVGSFKNFNDAGFRVEKGSKGIKIFVPVDVTTFTAADGKTKSLSTATPAEKAQIKAGTIETEKEKRFKLGNVFDISQTNADLTDLPTIFPNRHYAFNPIENGEGVFDALKKVGERYNIAFITDTDRTIGNAKGAFVQTPLAEKFILLNPTNNLEENISTSIHELTHAFLHSVNLRRETELSASSQEFQAEMSAHITAKHFGMDTSEKASDYIATWTKNGEDIEDKYKLLTEVHNTSRKIIQEVHGIMDQAPEQVQEKVQNNSQESQQQPPTPATNKVTSEEIAQAKRVDLLDYATSKGFSFNKDGKATYRSTEHDSLILDVKKNSFHWNSQSIHGDPIAFVMKVEGEASFPNAVRTLLGKDLKEHHYVAVDTGPFQYDTSKESKNFDAARKYLVNERKLSPKLIDCLHKKGYIRQDTKRNVLFCWVDDNKIVGVTEQGTVKSDKYERGSWKSIQRNSSGEHGFNFTIGKPNHLKFFESSIDALSYASLHPNMRDTRLISMEGLKDGTFKHYVEQAFTQLGRKPDSISFCLDNDAAGKNFSSKGKLVDFYNKLGGTNLKHIQTEFPPIPQGKEGIKKWDWNDQMKFVAEKRETNAFSKTMDQSVGMEL